jgi:hypothetical protein
MDETWEDVLKDLLEDWKYKAFKCKKKKKKNSLPTYPPADSVGRQCQTNNILRVASCLFFFLKKYNQVNSSVVNNMQYNLFTIYFYRTPLQSLGLFLLISSRISDFNPYYAT